MIKRDPKTGRFVAAKRAVKKTSTKKTAVKKSVAKKTCTKCCGSCKKSAPKKTK